MKKIIIIITVLFSLNTVFAQFTVDDDGKVGINNNNPQYYLDVQGDLRLNGWTDVIFDWTHGECCGQAVLYPETSWYFRLGTPTKKLGDIFATQIFCTSLTESSDENIKENITQLNNPIANLMQINGVKYNLKAEYYKGLPDELQKEYSKKVQLGFLAQNIEEFYPEIVSTDKETGVKAISYTRMVPILLEAIKEQQLRINDLENTVNELLNNSIGDEININKVALDNEKHEINTVSKLIQNSPNPFQESTIIKYNIPSNCDAAEILVFDMQGTLIRSFKNIINTENLVIESGDLFPGMYMYSLIVDGKEVDTKKMILTD